MKQEKRSAIVLVFNDRGEFALQRRADDDARYPGHWDFAAGGGIDPGERPEVAAVREMQEEIGVTAAVTLVGERTFEDEEQIDHMVIFTARHNGPFRPDGTEVSEVRFVSRADLADMLANEPFHPEVSFLWEDGLLKEAFANES